MDSNDLITLVNTTLPVLANSALGIKLIDCVSGVIKTLYEPRLVYRKKMAKYQAELEMNASIEGKYVFTQYEITRLKNFLNAASFANEEIETRIATSRDSIQYSDGYSNDEVIDFDWIMRFFDAVSLVSKNDMLSLWGKMLANEVTKPGEISLRTIDIVRNMTSSEAKSFQELCRYVMECGNMLFVFENGFTAVPSDGGYLHQFNRRSNAIIHNRNLNYLDNVNPLMEAGLMVSDHDFEGIIEPGDAPIVMCNKKMVAMIAPKENYKTVTFQPYMLTKSGRELYNTISSSETFEADKDYNVCCLRELQALFPEADFHISTFDRNRNDFTDVKNTFDN